MLNELQPDLRELIDLVRAAENFDVTVAATFRPETQSPLAKTPSASAAVRGCELSSCAASGHLSKGGLTMKATSAPTDPADIGEADKVKVIALYARVCPHDVLTNDDPRRDVIAAEVLDIGLAPSPEAALQVIAWWDPVADNLKPIIAGLRRSFSRMKLEGHYGAAQQGIRVLMEWTPSFKRHRGAKIG